MATKNPILEEYRRKQQLLAESHRRQFAGEDFQQVAIDLANRNHIAWESEQYTQLQSAPDPGCGCDFCQTADWQV